MKVFRAEDFYVYVKGIDQGADPLPLAERIARVANNKLKNDAMVMYGDDNGGEGMAMFQLEAPKKGHTHIGYLIGLEKMKCNHEVVKAHKITRDNVMVPYSYKCEKCGAKVKPKDGWEEVDK